jgi:hypothetical protein
MSFFPVTGIHFELWKIRVTEVRLYIYSYIYIHIYIYIHTIVVTSGRSTLILRTWMKNERFFRRPMYSYILTRQCPMAKCNSPKWI